MGHHWNRKYSGYLLLYFQVAMAEHVLILFLHLFPAQPIVDIIPGTEQSEHTD